MKVRVMPAGSSLRLKVAAGLVVSLAVVMAFLNLFLPVRLETLTLRAHGERASSMARLAAFNASAALYFDDEMGAGEAIQALEVDERVLYVIVRDDEGRAIAVWQQPGIDIPSDGLDGPDPEGVAFHVSAAAEHAGAEVGTVGLGLSLVDVHAAVTDIRKSIAWTGLLASLLGLVGVIVLGTVITNPLRQVVDAAQRISDGDLSARVPVSSRDEIGSLGESFNRMVDRVEAAHAELASDNRNLEEGVRRRTAALEREVEERTRAEARLSESEARFRAMFESSAIGIVLVSSAGRVLEANPAGHRMLRAEPGDLTGRELLGRFVVASPHRMREAIGELATGVRREIQTDLRVRGSRDRPAWLHLGLSFIRGNGSGDMMIATLEDITEQKSLEERLAQSQKLEAVGRLAGGVAHDFNNILTAITGLAEEASLGLDEEDPLRADLDEIRRAGWRAADLTRQLLAFGRRQTLQPRVLDLNAVIRENEGLLRPLMSENVRIVCELADDLPSIEADPGQLVQVLLNLAANARDAMPQGGELRLVTSPIEIGIEASRQIGTAGPGPHVALEVIDTGVGMDEARQKLVFEPFFTTKEVGKGTGLGLATVYGILKQSGGAVTVRSRPDHGSTFTVYLPAVARKPAPPDERGPTAEFPVGTETILLVEDEVAVRQLLGRILTRAGFNVLEARDGVRALDVERGYDGPIHAVLTDVVMPEMDGPTLVRELREARPGIAVVFVSGYNPGEAPHGGAVDDSRSAFLSKPFSPERILTVLRETLDASAMPAAPSARRTHRSEWREDTERSPTAMR